MAELEQFIILAKTQRGRACAALVQQVLNHKKIFVFGELMSIASVQALKEMPEFSREYKTLQLFAFGDMNNYYQTPSEYLELNEQQTFKLRQLTLLSLAAHSAIISFEAIRRELMLVSTTEVDSIIIETIYAGLIRGVIDQRKELLHVQSASARDVQMQDVDLIIRKLQSWNNICEVLQSVTEQSSKYLASTREQDILEQGHLQGAISDKKAKLLAELSEGVGEDNMDVDALGDQYLKNFKAHKPPKQSSNSRGFFDAYRSNVTNSSNNSSANRAGKNSSR